MTQLLVDDVPGAFRLELDGGTYIFGVLSGRIGMYEVRFALSPEEVASYRLRGLDFLRGLAALVRRDEGRFTDRRRYD